MVANSDTPHLPRLASIDAYGNGGFRFAGLSHRGSLLCLPSGIWAWPTATAHDIDEAALAPVFSAASDIGFLIVGTGREAWTIPEALRWRLREFRLPVEVMATGPAVRTYNILLAEQRCMAAALIAVD